MNKDRRTGIQLIRDGLDSLLTDTGALRDEEQEYFDNMPEGLQSSSKGEAAEQAISYLEEAIDSIESALSGLEEAMA